MIKWLQPYFFQFDQHHKTQVTDKKKQYAYSHTYLSSFCIPFHVKLIFTFLFFILTEFSGVLQHGHLCRLKKKEERGRKKRMD